MAERLTTNQEVPGSTPGWIDHLIFQLLCELEVLLFGGSVLGCGPDDLAWQ